MKGVPLLAGLNLVPRLGSAQQPCPGETRALKNRREWESAPPGYPKKTAETHKHGSCQQIVPTTQRRSVTVS